MVEAHGQASPERSREPAARDPAPPAAAQPDSPLLTLQQTVGNQAIQRHLRAHGRSPHLILGQQPALGNQAVQRLLHTRAGAPQPALQRATVQRQPGPPQTPIAERLKAILPSKVGMVAHIDRVGQLIDLFGAADLASLVARIEQHPEARAFTQTDGVGAVVALGDTQTPAGLNVSAARQALRTQPARYKRFALEVRTTDKRLAGVDTWAREAQQRQAVISPLAVVGLDAGQSASIVKAIQQLKTMAPAMTGSGTAVEAAVGDLTAAIGRVTVARGLSVSRDPLDRQEARIPLREAAEAATRARTAADKATQALDVEPTVAGLSAAIKLLQSMAGGEAAATTGLIDDVLRQLQQSIAELRAARQHHQTLPDSIRRVVFVLRSFLARNTPGYADAPSAAETAAFLNDPAVLEEDFEQCLGRQGAAQDIGIFISFADILRRQLQVGKQMATAGKPAPLAIPGQGDAETYFKALRTKPNPTVIDAYQDFAGAFFYHREVVQVDDLVSASVASLFGRPVSITGTRPLVCTGYANIGAHLLGLAGARTTGFIIGVRANDATLRGDKLDDGHALARLTRNGQTLFVSNDRIVFQENDGIGPNAVAWRNKNSPLFRGSGATPAAALEEVMTKLNAATARAKSRPGR